MADYREHYNEIRATGAELVAISVDPPNRSEALRQHLSLPFSILCDTGRRVVEAWGIYNARERGGIAEPAAFVVGPDRRVRYGAVGTVSTRVPASEITRVLKTSVETHTSQRKRYIPRLGDWLRALRNALRV